MRPYQIQSFKDDFGVTDRARLISARGDAARVVELSGRAPAVSAEDGAAYLCGELSALTLRDFPPRGSFLLVFRSGAEPTTLTVPQTLSMPEDFTVLANTRYEIHVRDGYALCAGWAVAAL